ncbi:Glycosyltransferase, catalytic subunit of cellulose synthase and poly-beta-1,6-N-acetylglucosamine synthase [Robiginitalea myxolifaciens]|uniref:Glycosyltransferase, catalytic subunit of cellulose synthase and poly-beta-1,6-N-acetylglucosamine synthase n=1 Tax=Robiginitalea myxolifaciens TaxID=400055 RepID=A0A1I6GSB7_9FLAO|nr:glycosyltransferase [Robiginitalea myxolifaciens]SFR45094.1 Glycosyltransferase, catalytic subunit of cellulose synthase and poly-beta-1,6-N-acetylglucosamine synthase [Robiginitalea myxolifaciens]
MKELISIVVPVFNRPEELQELLGSVAAQESPGVFEVVIVEDGSQRDARHVVKAFEDSLELQYHNKANTGPGDSRNFGMHKAKGTYFVLVDSDCILPPDYLAVLRKYLGNNPADCIGGRDAAHPDFNSLQQAVSYTMTAPLTTGGIRGGKAPDKNFQPRSFNMAISREAFKASGGFSRIHPGEDPDLSLRLKKMGFRIDYIPEWYVYHKRRINFRAFYRQVNRFGLARPILNRWHPGTARFAYWFPSLFILGLLFAMLLPVLSYLGILNLGAFSGFVWIPLAAYLLYFGLLFLGAWRKTGKLTTGLLAVVAGFVQFLGYGLGFLNSQMLLNFSAKEPEVLFPKLFFKS